MEKDLNYYRNELNRIDLEMQELFKKRMQIVEKIANYKVQNNLAIYDKTRENTQLENIAQNKDKIVSSYYPEVFKSILKVSKDYQKDLTNTLK